MQGRPIRDAESNYILEHDLRVIPIIPIARYVYAISRDARVYRIVSPLAGGDLVVRETARDQSAHIAESTTEPLIALYTHGRQRRFAVALLLMLSWGPPRPSERHWPEHINGDRHDLRLENLRWVEGYQDGSASRVGIVKALNAARRAAGPGKLHPGTSPLELQPRKIGGLVAALRIAAGLSQVALGRRCGLSTASIRDAESGRRVATAVRILAQLGIPISPILSENGGIAYRVGGDGGHDQ